MLTSMTSKEAILHVTDLHQIPSLYRLAKELSHEELKVSVTQISNYLRGTRMSRKVADRFLDLYEVTISDVYDNSVLRRNYSKGI